MSEPQRIAKFLSAAGVCSRRDAERLVAEGRVSVNGETLATPATLVADTDRVMVDGQKIKPPARDVARLFVYHKPAGLVTTHRDERGRNTVFDHLPRDLPRVISIGRLDLDSEGVLLLTTSGALARAMELPKNAMERVYRVRVRGTPMETHMRQLAQGVKADGVHYQPIDAILDRDQSGGRNCWLTLTLREGKNREIRRIFEHFDLPVSRLIRISYGGFELQDLPPGELAEVPARYVQQWMETLGVE